MVADPGLLQKAPHYAVLLTRGRRDRRQAAAADRFPSGIDAMRLQSRSFVLQVQRKL